MRNCLRLRIGVVVLVFVCAVQSVAASDDPRKDFENRWEGRLVVVKQTLLTLVYDQRSRLGTTSRERDGLTVVKSSGAYL